MDQLKMEVMQIRYNDYIHQIEELKTHAQHSIKMAKRDS